MFPIQGLCQFGSRSPSPRQNMSHKTEHVGHWEDLETWLSVVTVSLLPQAAETLKHQTQDQLDDNITSLMGQDPSQSYSHKELAKITGSLSHTLIATLKMSVTQQQKAYGKQKMASEKSTKTPVVLDFNTQSHGLAVEGTQRQDSAKPPHREWNTPPSNRERDSHAGT